MPVIFHNDQTDGKKKGILPKNDHYCAETEYNSNSFKLEGIQKVKIQERASKLLVIMRMLQKLK